MPLSQIENLTSYDTLFVTTHALDAPLSCAARLAHESKQGLKTLVVALFDSDDDDGNGRSLALLGVDQVRLGLPPAEQRSRCYQSPVTRTFGRDAQDEAEMRDRLLPIFDGIRNQTRALHVYLPLGTGEVDHRLALESGLRVFESGAMRNILLYEERPFSFSRGFVHMRLAQLGARLPPALTDIGDSSSLPCVLWGALFDVFVRRRIRGIGARIHYVWRAAGLWRRTRGWNPRKAFGLRVQPIFHQSTPEAGEIVSRAQEIAMRAAGGWIGTTMDLEASARRYARRLKKTAPVERYWLLLPPRDSEGVIDPMSTMELLEPEATVSSPRAIANGRGPAGKGC
jgi:hypothetical protein